MKKNSIILVWHRKWSTEEALIATWKINRGKNYFYFSSDPMYPKLYSFDGSKVIKECQKQENNGTMVYAVPCSWLTVEGEIPDSELMRKQVETEAYEDWLTRHPSEQKRYFQEIKFYQAQEAKKSELHPKKLWEI